MGTRSEEMKTSAGQARYQLAAMNIRTSKLRGALKRHSAKQAAIELERVKTQAAVHAKTRKQAAANRHHYEHLNQDYILGSCSVALTSGELAQVIAWNEPVEDEEQ